MIQHDLLNPQGVQTFSNKPQNIFLKVFKKFSVLHSTGVLLSANASSPLLCNYFRPASAHDTAISQIFVFNPEVWGLIVLTAVVVSCFASTTVYFSPVQRKTVARKKSLKIYAESVIESASMFSGQSVSESRVFTSSARLAIGVWALMTVVLVGTYSAYILAGLIARNVAPPFHDLSSLADCISRGQCHLVHTSRSVASLSTLFEQKSEFLSKEQIKLRDALGTVDAVDVYNRSLLPEKILSNDPWYNVVWMPLIQFAAMAEEGEICKFYLIQVGEQKDSFPFAHGSPLITRFYRAQEKILGKKLNRNKPF